MFSKYVPCKFIYPTVLGRRLTAKANLAPGQLRCIYSSLSQNMWGQDSVVGTAIRL